MYVVDTLVARPPAALMAIRSARNTVIWMTMLGTTSLGVPNPTR